MGFALTSVGGLTVAAYATWQDVQARWRTLTVDEQALATTLLEDAAVELDGACPPSDPPTARELSVRKIVSVRMVKRAMLSADAGGAGVTSLQQSGGPYQQTQQFANPLGDLYLTKADKRLLGCGGQRAFSIDLLASGDPEDEESS